MFSLVLQHTVVSASKHIGIILISSGRGGKRKRAHMSSGERRVREAQSDKKTNDSLTSGQLGTSANFVFLCLMPTGVFFFGIQCYGALAEPTVTISICNYTSSRVIYTICDHSYWIEFVPGGESRFQNEKWLLGALNFQQGVQYSLHVQFRVCFRNGKEKFF